MRNTLLLATIALLTISCDNKSKSDEVENIDPRIAEARYEQERRIVNDQMRKATSNLTGTQAEITNKILHTRSTYPSDPDQYTREGEVAINEMIRKDDELRNSINGLKVEGWSCVVVNDYPQDLKNGGSLTCVANISSSDVKKNSTDADWWDSYEESQTYTMGSFTSDSLPTEGKVYKGDRITFNAEIQGLHGNLYRNLRKIQINFQNTSISRLDP